MPCSEYSQLPMGFPPMHLLRERASDSVPEPQPTLRLHLDCTDCMTWPYLSVHLAVKVSVPTLLLEWSARETCPFLSEMPSQESQRSCPGSRILPAACPLPSQHVSRIQADQQASNHSTTTAATTHKPVNNHGPPRQSTREFEPAKYSVPVSGDRC